MSPRKKRKQFSEFLRRPCEIGINKEKYVQLELPLDIAGMTPHRLPEEKTEQVSSTLESAVTSMHADLNRQADYLHSLYPEAEVIKEIGSGLNYNRKKLKAILERIMSGDVERLVVGHKDRLARFGFELLRWICELNNTELVVCNNTKLSPEREMVEDILAIVHVFSCRLYGLRKYKPQIKEDQSLP